MANKYTKIDLSKYKGGYKKSKEVLDAEKRRKEYENAVKNYKDFKYANEEQYKNAMDSILNRKAFSYDVNADALYQQLANDYMRRGKIASQDAMGQAAALTGGYGNSYGATVGTQAYLNSLQQLTDMVPTLQGMALDAYNAEGGRLKDNLGILSADRSEAYGRYQDAYNKLKGERDYASNAYNEAYNRDYGKYTDNKNYDTQQYWNEYNAGYQKEQDALERAYRAQRDKIADAQWQKQFNLSASRSSGGGGGSRGGSSGMSVEQMRAAENSKYTQNFQAAIRTPHEWARQSDKAESSYTDYVDRQMEKWYNEGKLTDKEVAYLKGYYGIK